MASVYVANGSRTMGTIAASDSLFILEGNATIDTNIDQSGLAVTGIAVEEISRAFTGQIGTAAAPHKAEIDTRLVYMAQSGDMYYQAAGAANTCALLQINGGGTFHFVSGGTCTLAEIGSGSLQVTASAVVTTLNAAGGSVSITGTGTGVTTLNMWPGPSGSGPSVYTNRGGTTFTNKAGMLTLDIGTNTITTLNCSGPGKTILKESGTITTLNAEGHIPDTSALVRALTITNTTINMTLPGAQAFLDHPLITFTNTPARKISDGRII